MQVFILYGTIVAVVVAAPIQAHHSTHTFTHSHTRTTNIGTSFSTQNCRVAEKYFRLRDLVLVWPLSQTLALFNPKLHSISFFSHFFHFFPFSISHISSTISKIVLFNQWNYRRHFKSHHSFFCASKPLSHNKSKQRSLFSYFSYTFEFQYKWKIVLVHITTMSTTK